MRWWHRAWVVVVLLTIAGASAAGDPAAAEALFREGKRLVEAGRLEQACAKFEASHQADPSVGALLNLARCHERLGKKATAWGEYNEAAGMARRAGQHERERGARELAQALQPTLPRLIVEVPHPVQGLTVRRQGQDLPRASWGLPIPIDAGAHRIEASAPGYRPWQSTVEVPDGARVVVQLPALTPRPAAPTPSSAAPRVEGVNPLTVVGAIGVALGAAGLGVGIGLAVEALQQRDALEADCPQRVCDGARSRADAIEPYAHGATAALVIGGFAAGLGASFLVIATFEDTELEVAPYVGPEDGRLEVTWRF